ncbi:hypothetical protein Trydic_g22687 [Trypoxylus dichotomus]
MSAFPNTRRNGATVYVDASSNGFNSNVSSDFRAVIPDSPSPTSDVGLLSTVFPEDSSRTCRIRRQPKDLVTCSCKHSAQYNLPHNHMLLIC